jgi:hypothetical protein
MIEFYVAPEQSSHGARLCVMHGERVIAATPGNDMANQEWAARIVQMLNHPPVPVMSSRELATVLAALRYWQRQNTVDDGPEVDIATNGGTVEALHWPEIDALCERLNGGGAEEHAPGAAAPGLDALAKRVAELEGAVTNLVDTGRTDWVAIGKLEKRVEELAEMVTLETRQRLRDDGLLRDGHRELQEKLDALAERVAELTDSHDNLFKGWTDHAAAISSQIAAGETRISNLEQDLSEDCGARTYDDGLFERRGNIADRLYKVELEVEDLNRWQVEVQQGAK